MESVEINVAFQITDTVYFKADPSIAYVVRAFITRETGPTRYLCFSPEMGELEFEESELDSERSVF